MPYATEEARKQYSRDYYRRHRAAKLRYAQGHYSDNAERIRGERALKRDTETKARNATTQRARYLALRAEVIAAYGGKCACCTEAITQFLELDHIATDGAGHRREIGRGSDATYRWAKREGFPKNRFQLMCANCNQGRARNGGVCPHVCK
jgi:hypothetical protein